MTSYYPTIKVKLDKGAYMPERAHATDAGADIRTPVHVRVPPHGSATIDTGVHVELPPETKAELVSKSGLNLNRDIISTGLIDQGFTGGIRVKLYNLGDEWQVFERGDKVSQLVVSPVCYPDYAEADEIEGGERGENGYGSTGR